MGVGPGHRITTSRDLASLGAHWKHYSADPPPTTPSTTHLPRNENSHIQDLDLNLSEFQLDAAACRNQDATSLALPQFANENESNKTHQNHTIPVVTNLFVALRATS